MGSNLIWAENKRTCMSRGWLIMIYCKQIDDKLYYVHCNCILNGCYQSANPLLCFALTNSSASSSRLISLDRSFSMLRIASELKREFAIEFLR